MIDSSPTASVIETYGPIENWCTRSLSDFSRVFSTQRNPALVNFDEDLSSWQLDNAETVEGMFFGAQAYTGKGGLTGWDVSKVNSFADMVRALLYRTVCL